MNSQRSAFLFLNSPISVFAARALLGIGRSGDPLMAALLTLAKRELERHVSP